MLDKLIEIEEKFSQIEQRMQDPNVYTDPSAYAKLAREQKELSPVVDAYRRYKTAQKTIEESCELLSDPDFKEMAQEELDKARCDIEKIEEEIKVLLLPHDPHDDKNVIIEIRGGAGGEEASLFAQSLVPHVFDVCRLKTLENGDCQS